ncbi:MAG: ribonuclease H family protein [Bacteroidetes bacterium]|nr:ribonuclease H family protein [Bacteroidota bacterium]
MSSKKEQPKFYVVWSGFQPGIYKNWHACREQVHGYAGARYKAFPTLELARQAFAAGPEEGLKLAPTKVKTGSIELFSAEEPEANAICVDAACAGNPGRMEYKGVYAGTGTEIFRSPVWEVGTNNIGEFLAIVHALAWQKKNRLRLPVYSDSELALRWVQQGKAKSKLPRNQDTEQLYAVVERAEKWLKENPIEVPLRKWDTARWGQIPADFGRK